MTKAGTSKASSEQRKLLFLDAYLRNGENGTQAAIEVGISAKSAHVIASRWLKEAKVQKQLEQKRAEQRRKSGLTTDRVIQHLANIACFNPRSMLGANGKPLALDKIDENTAAGLHLELDGDSKVLRMRTVRPSEKNAALGKAIKILRLEDRPLPPPPDETRAPEDKRETAKRMLFLLARGAAAEEKAEAKPAPAKRKKIPAAA